MSILPVVGVRLVLAALSRTGFIALRQKGSHLFLKNHTTGKVTSVPVHPGDISRGLLNTIIKQAGLTVKEFIELL
jgi:predicted RNA binding protein YcfA (HicA-like mRNA interferase family)